MNTLGSNSAERKELRDSSMQVEVMNDVLASCEVRNNDCVEDCTPNDSYSDYFNVLEFPDGTICSENV